MNKKNLYTLLLSIAVLCGGPSLFAGKKPKNKNDDTDIYLKTLIEQNNKTKKEVENILNPVIDQFKKENSFFKEYVTISSKETDPVILIRDFYLWLITQYNTCIDDINNIVEKTDAYILALNNYNDQINQKESSLLAVLEEFNIPLDVILEMLPKICSKILASPQHLSEKEKSLFEEYSTLNVNIMLEKSIKKDISTLKFLEKNEKNKGASLVAKFLISYMSYLQSINGVLRSRTECILWLTKNIKKIDTKKQNFALVTRIQSYIQALYKTFNDIIDKTPIEQTEQNVGSKVYDLVNSMVKLAVSAENTLDTIEKLQERIELIQAKKVPQQKIKSSSPPKQQIKKLMPQEVESEPKKRSVKKIDKPIICKVEPTKAPFNAVSGYIACWLSGKMYWDESLKKLQTRYNYDDQYMEKNRDMLIKTHVLPIETYDYIEPLAKKEPWLNEDGEQTGWFYTIPGYLEDHKKDIKQRGIFTWGISFGNKCLHSSFSIRKDTEVYDLMTQNEYKKQTYKAAKKNETKEVILNKKDYEHNSVTQDAWDVIITNKETNTTVYLSKCIYKNKIKWEEK